MKIAATAERLEAYRNRPYVKRKKRAYDRQRYADGLVKASTWTKDHPIKAGNYRRDWFLKKEYGISLDDYRSLLKKQKYRCAVCMVLHTKKKPLHVDHCHETGIVRGLLCFKCNTALGKLGDDIVLVMCLFLYLEASCV